MITKPDTSLVAYIFIILIPCFSRAGHIYPFTFYGVCNYQKQTITIKIQYSTT